MYRGYGNAEIRLEAHGETDATSYSLTLHSAERRIDRFEFSARSTGRDAPSGDYGFSAIVNGHELALSSVESGREAHRNLAVPDEVVFDGPSPLWLIHLLVVTPPPADRTVTTPVLIFDENGGAMKGQFYRFERRGDELDIATLDQQGEVLQTFSVRVSESGVPALISSEDTVTEIMMMPQRVM